MENTHGSYVVEFTTRQGRVSERYESYEEARRRVEQFPAERLIGLPLIFEELADGSERLVREDGKPLQFHRILVEETRESVDEALPLAEDFPGPERKISFDRPEPSDEGWDDLPLV
jgi:hypothetical protein